MKNSEEMILDLLNRREEYIIKNSKLKKRLVLCTFSCAVVLTSVLMFPKVIKEPENEVKPYIENSTNMTFGTEISLFVPQTKSPGTDSFSEDELAHIEVIIDGDKSYTQMKTDEYKKAGIPEILSDSDFGEKLGNITELYPESSPISTPCSEEPSLKDCEVFSYAPACNDAILIVSGNNKCSLFIFNCFYEEGHSMKEILDIFAVTSAEEVRSIDYSAITNEASLASSVFEGKIKNPNEISSILSILNSIEPFKRASSLSGDPDWLNSAREEYKNSGKIIMIEAQIVLSDGLSINFTYEPYLGSGYIDGHYFLSEEENKTFCKIFSKEDFIL